MHIKEYIRSIGKSANSMGPIFGYSPQYFDSLINGRTKINEKIACFLSMKTEGKVSPEEWMSLYIERKKQEESQNE